MRAVASRASALFRDATAASRAAMNGTWSMTNSTCPFFTFSPSLMQMRVMQPLTCGRISTICLPVSRAEYCRSSVMSFFVTTIVRYCCAPCSRFLSSPHDVTSSPPQTAVRTHENNAFFISFVSMLSIVMANLRKISYFLTIFSSLLKTNNISQANN